MRDPTSDTCSRNPIRSLVVGVLTATIVSCSSPSPTERGCQRYTDLVDDIAISLQYPGRLLDGISGEVIHGQVDNPEFNILPGESEAERDIRFGLRLGGTKVIITLESMARYYFHDDDQFSSIAYMLWVSATAIENGGLGTYSTYSSDIYAKELAAECDDHGHSTPTANTDVITEYLEDVAAAGLRWELELTESEFDDPKTGW